MDIAQDVNEKVKYRGLVTSSREPYVLPHTLLDVWMLDVGFYLDAAKAQSPSECTYIVEHHVLVG